MWLYAPARKTPNVSGRGMEEDVRLLAKHIAIVAALDRSKYLRALSPTVSVQIGGGAEVVFRPIHGSEISKLKRRVRSSIGSICEIRVATHRVAKLPGMWTVTCRFVW